MATCNAGTTAPKTRAALSIVKTGAATRSVGQIVETGNARTSVCTSSSAHAGIDQSNVDHSGGEAALLLPVDPDASARALCDGLRARTGKALGIIISDSANRPWRLGTIGIAIGAAGTTVLDDHRGGNDLYGRELKVTLINRADSIATAATLVIGETTERTPAAIVRGFGPEECQDGAAMINRPLEEDLFR